MVLYANKPIRTPFIPCQLVRGEKRGKNHVGKFTIGLTFTSDGPKGSPLSSDWSEVLYQTSIFTQWKNGEEKNWPHEMWRRYKTRLKRISFLLRGLRKNRDNYMQSSYSGGKNAIFKILSKYKFLFLNKVALLLIFHYLKDLFYIFFSDHQDWLRHSQDHWKQFPSFSWISKFSVRFLLSW